MGVRGGVCAELLPPTRLPYNWLILAHPPETSLKPTDYHSAYPQSQSIYKSANMQLKQTSSTQIRVCAEGCARAFAHGKR